MKRQRSAEDARRHDGLGNLVCLCLRCHAMIDTYYYVFYSGVLGWSRCAGLIALCCAVLAVDGTRLNMLGQELGVLVVRFEQKQIDAEVDVYCTYEPKLTSYWCILKKGRANKIGDRSELQVVDDTNTLDLANSDSSCMNDSRCQAGATTCALMFWELSALFCVHFCPCGKCSTATCFNCCTRSSYEYIRALNGSVFIVNWAEETSAQIVDKKKRVVYAPQIIGTHDTIHVVRSR